MGFKHEQGLPQAWLLGGAFQPVPKKGDHGCVWAAKIHGGLLGEEDLIPGIHIIVGGSTVASLALPSLRTSTPHSR